MSTPRAGVARAGLMEESRGPARDLLYGSPIRIRANSLTFTRGAAGSTVDIIFALTEEELDSRIVVDPIQFAMGIRLRNS